MKIKSLCPLLTALLLLGAPKSFADTVSLYGVCALFGDNLGFFELDQPAARQPVKFMLAEGESKFGITLVTVDAGHHRAQIEQCGVKRFLYVHGAPGDGAVLDDSPAAIMTTGAGTLADADQRSLAAFLSSSDAQRIKAGNPVWSGGGTPSKPAADNPGDKDTAKDNSSAGTGGDKGLNSAKVVDPEPWYLESLDIERDRLTTAEAVYAREASPLPRTPLTPPNTPARLIGKETFYSNRIPGYIVPGYTQPLATLP